MVRVEAFFFGRKKKEKSIWLVEEKMASLSFITCAACMLFLTGTCSCFVQSGGPRSTGTCQSCKCITIWYLTQKKKQSRKTIYHVNNDRSCECLLQCLREPNNSRCLHNGKLAYHKECREKWKPCAHMALVTAQLDEYIAAVQDSTAIVPDGCIPLIGYLKKKSTLLEIETAGRNFLEERKIALQSFKKKHKLGPERALVNVRASPATKKSVRFAVSESHLDLQTVQNVAQKNILLNEYFDIMETILCKPPKEVIIIFCMSFANFFFQIRYRFLSVRGDMHTCTYEILQNLVHYNTISHTIVDLYFAMLETTVGSCIYLPSTLLSQLFCEIGLKISHRKAAKMVLKSHKKLLFRQERCLQQNYFFLPFLDISRQSWVLIVLTPPQKNLPSLLIFDTLCTSSAISPKQRVFLR